MSDDVQSSRPAIWDDWKRAALSGANEDELAAKIEAQRDRVSRMKDPFTPIANNDAAARAKETVLWEDDDTMVIVDAFSFGPKALVVPKAVMLFPIDGSVEYIARLAEIANAVSGAFVDLGATGGSKTWINPPFALTVRQLHVHVQPPIARPANKAELWASVRDALAIRLAS